MKFREKLLALACIGILTGAPAAWAQNVKLGVLTDLGGPHADSSGQGAVEATKMAAEDLKAELGSHQVGYGEPGKPRFNNCPVWVSIIAAIVG